MLAKGDITMLIFIVGLILFLVGLEGSKLCLKKLSSRTLKEKLKKFTDRSYLCLIGGIVITACLQSSSAVSIILIGLLEAGFIKLKAALLVMLGANIGTTVTLQIISFPILVYSPYLIILGLVLIFFKLLSSKNKSKKIIYMGLILLSFGIIFNGLNLMTSYFDNNQINKLLFRFLTGKKSIIFIGIPVGAIITALIQSSSAVTGIVLSFLKLDLITLTKAIEIVIGTNLGTCVTAFIASINTGIEAKNLALGHFLFNLWGTIITLTFFDFFIDIIIKLGGTPSRNLANAHTFFNIIIVLSILPFFRKPLKNPR